MTITPFTGLLFWTTTIIFIAVNALLQKYAPLWIKSGFMILASIGVISLAISKPIPLLLLLLLITTVIYIIGKSLLTSPEQSIKKRVLFSTIISITIFLCFFKYAIIQTFLISIFNSSKFKLEHHLFFMGVSYFSFKFIHFLVECDKGKIEKLSYLTFLNYILFFPNFFSGPINRYNSFSTSIATKAKITDNFLVGGQRIITGLFKKIVLGDFLFPYSIAALNLNTATPLEIIVGIYTYGFYIYFNFSGYTDMAIGCGKMVGIELPENFNYPFFKRNLQQFWANWHISLTSWLTDYIYWPLVKKIRHNKTLQKKPVTISNICIFLTFVICGLWHGDGLNYLIWGAYHGVGLAILNGYTYVIRRYTNNKVRKFIGKSPIAYGLSNFITFQFVSFGFLIFACDMSLLAF